MRRRGAARFIYGSVDHPVRTSYSTAKEIAMQLTLEEIVMIAVENQHINLEAGN